MLRLAIPAAPSLAACRSMQSRMPLAACPLLRSQRILARAEGGEGGKPPGDDEFASSFSKELARRGLSSASSDDEDASGTPPKARSPPPAAADSGSTDLPGSSSFGAAPGGATNPFRGSAGASSPSSSPRAGSGSSASSSGSSSPPPRSRPRAPPPPMTEGQRERSMALVNEGLEGLIPRVTELLKLGFGAFLPFLPFMALFSLLFTGIFWVFGDKFLHSGREGVGMPKYIDPMTLLSEPTLDPMVPFDVFDTPPIRQ